MRVAIISDIHSNYLALKEVLNESRKYTEKYIILGDIFGYYPWAVETYELLKGINIFKMIKGNHDALIGKDKSPITAINYFGMIKNNENQLANSCPDAISWIKHMSTKNIFYFDGKKCSIYHGTPCDPVNGRYYPNDIDNNWLIDNAGIIMLGHTHYPLFKKTLLGGIVLNPGSVGQPRDGLLAASWGIFDFNKNTFKLFRTGYDIKRAISLLKKIHWNRRSIAALQKNYSGSLKY